MQNSGSEQAAQNFLRLIKSGQIKKVVLPNSAKDYTQRQEREDLERYKIFLKSFAYDDIKNCEVFEDL